MMQVKTYPGLTVLYATFNTSLQTLDQYVGTVARQLQVEAAQQQLLASGPLYWIYYGADGKPDTIFTLEVALPVSGKPVAQNGFLCKILPPFRSLATLHSGAWSKLAETYGSLVQHAFSNKLSMSGENRELYLNIDFEDPANNLVEVQIGLS